VKVGLGRVEAVFLQSVRRPQVGSCAIWIEDLGVELRGGSDASDVAVDDLGHADMSTVGDKVECLSFDVC